MGPELNRAHSFCFHKDLRGGSAFPGGHMGNFGYAAKRREPDFKKSAHCLFFKKSHTVIDFCNTW